MSSRVPSRRPTAVAFALVAAARLPQAAGRPGRRGRPDPRRRLLPDPYGEVRTSWTKKGGVVALTVTVPPGSTAEVHVPGSGAVHQVGSGTWTFRSDR